MAQRRGPQHARFWRDGVERFTAAITIFPIGGFCRCGSHRDHLLQLRVLGFDLFVDRDVGIGVLPEGEEVFVRGERPDAGGVGSL